MFTTEFPLPSLGEPRRRIIAALALVCFLCTLPPSAVADEAVTLLHTFAYAEGGSPSTLVLGSDGNYYGTNFSGGPVLSGSGAGYGTIFRMTPGGVVTVLHGFAGSDGDGPTGLAVGADGNLYGTTNRGGANGAGAVFRITLAGVFTTIYSFQPNQYGEALSPSRLTLGNGGLLYGMTAYGGDNAGGTVYQVTTSGAVTTLYSFPKDSGPAPVNGGLLFGHDGNLYGMSSAGGGVLFKITSAGAFSVVHTFIDGEGQGINPLVQDAAGNLYAAVANGSGTMFVVTPNGTLTTFSAPNGEESGPLIDGGDGSFYGMTAQGGEVSCACGTLFKVTPAGAFTMLYYFPGAPGMRNPYGSLLRGSDGFFYGTATDGLTGSSALFRYDRTYPTPPDITLSVAAPTIVSGDSTTLTWRATSADTCVASDGWSGAQSAAGSFTVSPITFSLYTLSCTGPGGTASVTTQVAVEPAPTAEIGVDRSPVNVGDTVTLTWSASNTTGCHATGAWSGAQPTFGSEQVTSAAPGSYVYTIRCTAILGQQVAVASVTLVVSAPPATGGSGGGGALGLVDLLSGTVVAMRRLGQRRRRVSVRPYSTAE